LSLVFGFRGLQECRPELLSALKLTEQFNGQQFQIFKIVAIFERHARNSWPVGRPQVSPSCVFSSLFDSI